MVCTTKSSRLLDSCTRYQTCTCCATYWMCNRASKTRCGVCLVVSVCIISCRQNPLARKNAVNKADSCEWTRRQSPILAPLILSARNGWQGVILASSDARDAVVRFRKARPNVSSGLGSLQHRGQLFLASASPTNTTGAGCVARRCSACMRLLQQDGRHMTRVQLLRKQATPPRLGRASESGTIRDPVTQAVCLRATSGRPSAASQAQMTRRCRTGREIWIQPFIIGQPGPTREPNSRRGGQCWVLCNAQKHCALEHSACPSNYINMQPLANSPGRGVCSLPWVSRQQVMGV